MKLSRASFIRALEIALGPAELEHERSPEVQFSDSADGILVRGQTGEAAGWDVVPSKDSIERAILVPGRPFLQMLREIRRAEIELVQEEGELHLRAGAYRAVIWTRPASSEPSAANELLKISMSTNLVGKLGGLAAYARPKGRNKSVFPGIHLLLDPEGLKVVVTDGRRLAQAKSADCGTEEDLSWILPGRFLLLASRYLKVDAPTELCVSEGRVGLWQGNRGIAGTILAGPMPSYQALLPGELEQQGWLRRSRVIEAIRQARLFSSRAMVRLDDCKLYLRTPETSEGMAEIIVGVEWLGPPYLTQLNTDELLEALENLPGEEIVIAVQGERVPLVLRSETTILATLMPLLW